MQEQDGVDRAGAAAFPLQTQKNGGRETAVVLLVAGAGFEPTTFGL